MNDDSTSDFTTTITVEQTPEEAFRAITDVRGWWSGEIEGPTDQLDGEFTYRYGTHHHSKQRITELVPGRKVTWLVVDSYLEFTRDKREWNGTRVTFDLAREGDRTVVRFTHAGLVPARECYGRCVNAWSSYIRGSLRSLITTGVGQPNAKHGS